MSNQATVDVIKANGSGGISGSGHLAQKLLQSNFNVNALRDLSVLRKDEWIQYDTAVVETAQRRLVAVGDLLSRGLTYNLDNALGVTQVQWEQTGDLGDAIVSMSGLTQGQNDKMDFALQSVPVPIVHKDFHINIRTLESSRREGQPLDTMQAEVAARIVSEKIESILFLGSNVAGTANKIYGYLTAPNRNTGSTTSAWATGANAIADVLAMIGKAMADNMFGPYIIYVPVAYFVKLGDDFKADSDKSTMSRLLEIPGIEAIKPSSDLTGNNVVLVQLTRDVVDMIDGIQPTVVMWESHGGFLVNFKVLAIMVPRVKNDKSLQSGIVHYS
jgi:uncharacterized linocin/CFP29 family protein